MQPAFAIDLAALEQRQRELSRALHPDRYVGRPASERRLALGRAIEVNQAARTLKDPVERALALLQRAGVHVERERAPAASPAFLMEIMDLREELAALKTRRDRAALTRLVLSVKGREERVLGELERRFTELLQVEPAATSAATAALVLAGIGELRYLLRFLDEAHSIEDEWDQ